MRQPRGNRLFKGSRRRRVGSKHRFKPRQRYRKFRRLTKSCRPPRTNVQVDLLLRRRSLFPEAVLESARHPLRYRNLPVPSVRRLNDFEDQLTGEKKRGEKTGGRRGVNVGPAINTCAGFNPSRLLLPPRIWITSRLAETIKTRTSRGADTYIVASSPQGNRNSSTPSSAGGRRPATPPARGARLAVALQNWKYLSSVEERRRRGWQEW